MRTAAERLVLRVALALAALFLAAPARAQPATAAAPGEEVTQGSVLPELGEPPDQAAFLGKPVRRAEVVLRTRWTSPRPVLASVRLESPTGRRWRARRAS
ncbi:MAG: hypothetical protein WKG00_35265 [Polyangiaceae bacterium]